MKQRKFSKTGLALIGSMLVCLLICLAVLLPGGGPGGHEAEDLNDADTPDLKTVLDEGAPVLIYDKRPEAQALVAAYENGAMEKVRIEWEDGDEVIVDTPSEIKEVYRLFKNIVVTGDAETEIPDGEEIELAFSLQDEAPCRYTLYGESALAIDDADEDADDTEDETGALCTISGAEPRIEYLKTLK